MAVSMPRVISSPTTTPMLPPMKPYSMTARMTGVRSSSPRTTRTASSSPVFSAPLRSRPL